jgi:hypothetical protein
MRLYIFRILPPHPVIELFCHLSHIGAASVTEIPRRLEKQRDRILREISGMMSIPPANLSRRSFLCAAAAGIPAAVAQKASRPPNVVVLLADDMGWGDLSSYGAPDIRTPNIDSLGHSGVRFTAFYDNGPECSPTRSSLMTGRYQQRVGGLECAIGLHDVGRYDDAIWLQKRGELGLPVSETSMPQILKSHGYDTGMFGKMAPRLSGEVLAESSRL